MVEDHEHIWGPVFYGTKPENRSKEWNRDFLNATDPGQVCLVEGCSEVKWLTPEEQKANRKGYPD